MPWGRREEEMPIKCPLCRLPSLVTQIHYVSCNGDGEDTPIKVSNVSKTNLKLMVGDKNVSVS